jgi:hypothetical protein
MIESSLQDIYPAKIFHDQIIEYLDEYAEYLLAVKSDSNVITKRVMLQQFINYLFNEHLVKSLNEITPEMLRFGNLSEEEYPDLVPNTPQGQILATLSDFFEFIYGKHGLRNDTFSEWLKTELQ